MKLYISIILSCLCFHLSMAQEKDIKLYQLLKMDNLNKARQEFKVHYGQTNFTLSGPFNDDQAIDHSEHPVHVTLKSLEVIKGTLKKFGDQITGRIAVSFEDINVDDGKQIVQVINEKPFKSLKTIELKNCKKDVLKGLTKPFDSVDSLVFSTNPTEPFEIGSKNLDKIFPKLERMTIEHTLPSDWAFINGKFPKLTKLSVDLPKPSEENAHYDSHVVDFLKNNAQIIDITVRNINSKLLNDVNEILPGIEKLHLKGLSQNYLNHESLINLDTVMKLVIETDHEDEIPKKAIFNNLRQLSLKFHHDFTDEWIEYLDEHVNHNLFFIDIDTEYKIDFSRIKVIQQKFPNTFVMKLKSQSKCVAEDIVSILKRGEKLFQMDLILEMSNLEQKRLKKIISIVWSVRLEALGSLVKIHLERDSHNQIPLDKLKLDELLAKVQSDPELSLDKARDVFKQKHSQFGYIIYGPLTEDDEYAIKIDCNGTLCGIKNLYTINKLLDTFGSFVQWIMIDFKQLGTDDGKQILEHINVECTKSLQQFYLLNSKEYVLESLKTPFESVHEMGYSSRTMHVLPSHLLSQNVSQLFPALNSIIMNHTSAGDWKFFDGHLPGLNAFAVELPQSRIEDGINESQIVNFIKNNTQITQLTITHTTLKLLKDAHDNAPNLVNLTLNSLSTNYMNYQGDTIDFRTVKSFELNTSFAHEIPGMIKFHQLEKLTLKLRNLDSPYDHSNIWVHFILEQVNSNVSDLTLDVNRLSQNQLYNISIELPKLKTVNISSNSWYSVYDVVDFIRACTCLNTLQMRIQMSDYSQESLQGRLPKGWKVESFSNYGRETVEFVLKRVDTSDASIGFFGNIREMQIVSLIWTLVLAKLI